MKSSSLKWRISDKLCRRSKMTLKRWLERWWKWWTNKPTLSCTHLACLDFNFLLFTLTYFASELITLLITICFWTSFSCFWYVLYSYSCLALIFIWLYCMLWYLCLMLWLVYLFFSLSFKLFLLFVFSFL